MIFIWRGYGFWVVLLPILAFAPFVFFNEIYGVTLFQVILFCGYILIAHFGIKLNRKPIQKYKNLKSGETFEVEENTISSSYPSLSMPAKLSLSIRCK